MILNLLIKEFLRSLNIDCFSTRLNDWHYCRINCCSFNLTWLRFTVQKQMCSISAPNDITFQTIELWLTKLLVRPLLFQHLNKCVLYHSRISAATKIKYAAALSLVFRAMCNMLFKIQSTFAYSLLCFHKTCCKKLSYMTNLDGFAYKFVVKDHVLEHILYLIAYFKELSGATINTMFVWFSALNPKVRYS